MDRSLRPRYSDDQPAGQRRLDLRANEEPRQSFSAQMRDFLRRNATWFLVAGLSLLLLQDIFGTHGVLAMRRSQVQVQQVQKQIDQLDSENQRLEGRVKSLKTDPTAIERIAREEMGLKRPGEHVFWLTPKPGDASSGDASGSASAPAANQPSTSAKKP
ncbi:MAG: septum formation initiator family protein [Candidatus Acidiferrales bacterium]